MYGFGNWEDTAAFVGRKTAEEVRDHYIAVYVGGTVGKVVWSSVTDSYKITDHTVDPKDGPLSPSLTVPLPKIAELSLAEQQHLGYMPKRDDFEREFDNEAEALISTLSINPTDDDEVDVDMKLAHVDMYRRKLAERSKKKTIARDYNLVSLFYKTLTADEQFMSQMYLQPSLQSVLSDEDTNHSVGSLSAKSPAPNSSITISAPSKKRSCSPSKTGETAEKKENQKLLDKFKVFAQFQSSNDQQAMFDNFKREKELKVRIRELIRFRRNGLKRLSEVADYESARIKRDKKKENKKKVSIRYVCVMCRYPTFSIELHLLLHLAFTSVSL